MASFGGQKLWTFKCVKCSNYLSVLPIRVRKDGKSVCGRCNDAESNDSRENKILPEILKRMKFPCRFGSNGCSRLLSLDEVKQHENECSYNENADTGSKEAKVPNGLVDQLKCTNCHQFLNVFPVNVTKDGNITCGRCTPDKSADRSGQFRDLNFEDILKMCPFPCRYKDVGCTVSLLWNTTEQHEKDCQFNKSFTEQCPSLSQNNCHWDGNIHELAKHFSNNHSDLILPDSLMLVVNLTQASQKNFLLRHKNEVFLVNAKVQQQENKLFIVLFHITKKNNDEKYNFCIEYTTEYDEKIITAKTKAKLVQEYKPKEGENLSEMQEFDINQLGFAKSDLSKATFKIELHKEEQLDDGVVLRKTQENETKNLNKNDFHKKPVPNPRNSAVIQETSCKWCFISIMASESTTHNKICKKRKEVCQKCSSEILISDMDEHSTNCKGETKKTTICKLCETKINQEDLINHEDVCDRRVTTCELCSAEISSKKVREHEASCSKRKVTCKLCGNADIPQDDLASHEEICPNKRSSCQFCNIKFCASEMENHLETCKSKQNACQWCNENVDPKDLKYHHNSCPKKEVSCPSCSEKMASDQFKEHATSCSGQGDSRCKWCSEVIKNPSRPSSVLNKVALQEHEERCRKRAAKCSWPGCVAEVPFTDLKNHVENECPKRKINCKWCSTLILHLTQETHYSTCIKREIPCQHCSRVFIFEEIDEHQAECTQNAQAQANANAQAPPQAQTINDDRKYKCHKCAEFGEVPLGILLQHIKENHGADLIEGNTCNHSLAVGKGLKWHMESTELGLFWCRSVCFDGGSIKFLAQLVGAPKTAGDDIRVEIGISKEEETSLVKTGSCLKYGANDGWSVEIKNDDFSQFIEDGKVNYTFTLAWNK